ncbi:MAG: lytic transglycosylase [Rhodobacterales bacterium 65-51]|uniref:lytic transglycosylase domain-containing protein n=1 Tax=uncultured Gemmobacter sp. TaxID=1095917 RepID=UPI00095B1E1E|nr:lytic transglycosylase domain-containing protein [uncultured Gemmobacter sp.]OJY27478.1 MAG: lytic transglycosylase [Rhodobacterales bacterium 65-51]
MSQLTRRSLVTLTLATLVAGCGGGRRREARRPDTAQGPAEINHLISHYSRVYDVPESLVHRVVKRESNYNPGARNGPYYGLMQILPQTARTMGHRGSAQELLDADTNLKYGVKYLRGAWLVSRGNHDRAVGWYSRGYYYEAKRMGLLEKTGLRG